jgi:hypothetical protein
MFDTYTMKMSTHYMRLKIALPCWMIAGVLAFASCKSLSTTEVAAARVSQDALCKAVVASYRSQDLDAFSQLALSAKQLKDMMSKVKVPESAKRQTIMGKHALETYVQDSLHHVLAGADLDWTKVEFVRFAPERKPIEIAPGYKYCLGKMVLQAGDRRLLQPLTIVEADGGKFFVGDFGPITPDN